jgi:hypothetical protein
VLELRRRYDLTEQVIVGRQNARIVRELGLRNLLAGALEDATTRGLVR